MSIEDYHRLPFSLVWKQEYWDGHLVETPREVVVHATLPVTPGAAPGPLPLRAANPEDEPRLLPCFRASFVDAFEYCDYPPEKFEQSARESLGHFFAGLFHRPLLAASRIAVAPPGGPDAGQPVGAALVLEQDEGWALLDMIFVAPNWQRRGLATALAAATVNALHESGAHRTLVSRYHLGNEASGAWHHRFGFADEPDLRLAQLRLRATEHELRRHHDMNTLTPELERELTSAREYARRDVDRLQTLLDAGDEEAVWPWRKWRRKE